MRARIHGIRTSTRQEHQSFRTSVQLRLLGILPTSVDRVASRPRGVVHQLWSRLHGSLVIPIPGLVAIRGLSIRVPFTLLPFLGTTAFFGFQAFAKVFWAKPLVATAASTAHGRRVEELIATSATRSIRESFTIVAGVSNTKQLMTVCAPSKPNH